jgi:Rod binding domain-containing protein
MQPVGLNTPSLDQERPKNVTQAAKQFEALLINQMLRSTHADDDDVEKSTMLDVADQQFSQLLANNGGLGLAQMIVKGLSSAHTPTPNCSTPVGCNNSANR